MQFARFVRETCLGLPQTHNERIEGGGSLGWNEETQGVHVKLMNFGDIPSRKMKQIMKDIGTDSSQDHIEMVVAQPLLSTVEQHSASVCECIEEREKNDEAGLSYLWLQREKERAGI